MKYYELDNEEKGILNDFNDDKLVSSVSKDEIKKYRQYAKNVLNKSKNINIRLSESDLWKIKSKALEKGIPYQTLISSLIHQYARGRKIEI